MHSRRYTKDAKVTTTETNVPPDIDNADDEDDDLDLDAIELYRAADLESDIDPDHRDAQEESDSDSLHDYAAQSSITLAHVPRTATL